MVKAAKNKMIDESDNKAIAPGVLEEDYFFPDYSVTVRAASREEAEKKVKELTNK